MKEEWQKPEYAKMPLVATVYGDDAIDKSYREAQGLMKAHPNLRGIISPTAVGIVAAARAVDRCGRNRQGFRDRPRASVGDEAVRAVGRDRYIPALGPGRPRLCRRHVRRHDRARQDDGETGTSAEIGKLGDMTVEADNNTYLERTSWSSTSPTSSSMPRSSERTDPACRRLPRSRRSSLTRPHVADRIPMTPEPTGRQPPQNGRRRSRPAGPGRRSDAAGGRRAAPDAIRHSEELSGRSCVARCRAVALSGPGDGADRRERRGQVDAGQDPDRHLPARRRRDPRRRRRPSNFPSAHAAFEPASPRSTRKPCCSTNCRSPRTSSSATRRARRFGLIDWKTMRADAAKSWTTMRAGHIDADVAAERPRHRQQAPRRGRPRHVDRRAASSSWTSRRPPCRHKEIDELFLLIELLKARRQGDPVHQPQVRRDLPHRRPLHRVPRRRDGRRGADRGHRARARSSR